MRRAIAGVALWMVAAASPVLGEPHADYVSGYNAWIARQWADASRDLSRYWRNVPFGRTYDVAYWLGTSWCRQKGSELPGADMLDWSYHFQSMPEAVRTQFREERDVCIQWLKGDVGERVAPTVVLAGAWTNATARASGKTFYLGNQDKGGLTAYPVRVKRTIDRATFSSRLVEIGKPNDVLKDLQARVPGFRLYVSQRFAIASPTHSDAQLEKIAAQLDTFALFLGKRYGMPMPSHYMTIYLFPEVPALRKWADQLHGFDASSMTLGYSLQNDLSVLAMVPSTQVGTILHELFHLMLRANFGDAPQWLDEGVASLYETSTLKSGDYFGEPNWRSRIYAGFSHAFSQLTLRDVMATPWFSDEPSLAAQPGEMQLDPNQQAYLLAYSRMFALYLQEQGSLPAVLQAFQHRQTPAQFTPAPEQAVVLLQSTLGKPLSEIQQAFLAWTPKGMNPDARFHAPPVQAPVSPVPDEGDDSSPSNAPVPNHLIDR